MISKRISFINYRIKKNSITISNKLKSIISKQDQVLMSLGKNYKNSFTNKQLNKYKSFSNFRIIAMGGSILGTEAIHHFLGQKVKKEFIFLNDLNEEHIKSVKRKNLKAEYTRFGPPQTPIIRNIGINPASKNK